MFSQFNSEQMEAYFQRVNAELGRMPQQDRAELHLELRQHLEGLVAAHEELGASPEEALEAALQQFGEPKKIGRRMFWEWKKTTPGTNYREINAALAALGLFMSLSVTLSFALGVVLGVLGCLGSSVADHCWDILVLFCVPGLAGTAVGRWFPNGAIVGTFYSVVALATFLLSGLLAMFGMAKPVFQNLTFAAICWLLVACSSAYVSSVRTRRRWNPFHLADLKLRLR